VRRDIERTRADMSYTVDQIEDRVVPSRIIERRTERMRNWFGDMRDNVMGTMDDTQEHLGDIGSSMGEGMHGMAENVQQMPQMARRRTQGSPLGAGLFALGAGLVLGSILPASRAERQAARQMMPKLEPLKEQAREAATDLKDNLKEPAQEAMHAIGDRGKEAGDHVKEQATEGAQDVAHQASSR
jgi:hypothetical protein